MDKIKAFGFRYSTRAGVTWGIDNVRVPEEKKAIVEGARKEERVVVGHFEEGLLTDEETIS